jgi:Mn-containing catalase
MYTVNIGEPDVRFGNMLLEQFGGANGELETLTEVLSWVGRDEKMPRLERGHLSL